MVSHDPRDSRFGPWFRDVASAMAAAPSDGSPWHIAMGAGSFFGKLVIERPNVTISGAGSDRSILSFDAHAGGVSPDGTPWGTERSATLTVTAPGFSAQAIGIHNDFDYNGTRASLSADPRGANGLQAVALALSGAADNGHFDDVAIIGHQDTLFVDSGTHRFDSCRIEGSVDFVFGAGNALFRDCVLHSRFRPTAGFDQGCITAASTPITRTFGFRFVECALTRDAEVPDESVWLGRPWRPTRTFPDGRYGDPNARASVLFDRCRMDLHVRSDRWTGMSYRNAVGEPVWLPPEAGRFSESGSRPL